MNVVRRLAIAALLAAALAPEAVAGDGANAKVHGPGEDGRYTIQTYLVANPSKLRITAWAEGLVGGKRLTVPVKVERTREKGVWKFARSWPAQGTWAIRMDLGDRTLPRNVTALGENGDVRANKTVWEGDGLAECLAILDGDDC
jgi:hypothetical protein